MIIRLILMAIFTFSGSQDKGIAYLKSYHANVTLKSEGWVDGQTKIKYWKFYHANGKIDQEGHYKGGGAP